MANPKYCVLAVALFGFSQSPWAGSGYGYWERPVDHHRSERRDHGHRDAWIRGRPAPRQPEQGYMSAKCVQQRNSPMATSIHTKDCDHPAYSGAAYPPGYGGHQPYGGPAIIINNYGRPDYRR